jgi:hypothetical protein
VGLEWVLSGSCQDPNFELCYRTIELAGSYCLFLGNWPGLLYVVVVEVLRQGSNLQSSSYGVCGNKREIKPWDEHVENRRY